MFATTLTTGRPLVRPPTLDAAEARGQQQLHPAAQVAGLPGPSEKVEVVRQQTVAHHRMRTRWLASPKSRK